MHELYCLGHLAEAAAAYYLLSGSEDLIEVVRRMIELIREVVLPKGGYPGHQELEIGLMRLYELTKDELFLDTAGYFIQERGKKDAKGEIFLDREAFERGGDPYSMWGIDYKPWFHAPRGYEYAQAHAPLTEQKTIEGHSVRAMYFLTAAQHYSLVNGSESKKIHEAVVGYSEIPRSKKCTSPEVLGVSRDGKYSGPITGFQTSRQEDAATLRPAQVLA